VRNIGPTVPVAETVHHTLHFCRSKYVEVFFSPYLNILLVNVTMEVKLSVMCTPDDLKNCRISMQKLQKWST
jgi:hypothetical protein